MRKIIHELKDKLESVYNELGKSSNEVSSSLLLEIIQSCLNWQKKKAESFFESAALHESKFSSEDILWAKENGYVTECLKPTKKNEYFLNLTGLYLLENNKIGDIEIGVMQILQKQFYKKVQWTIKDEEKVILVVLLLFNSIGEAKALEIKTNLKSEKIWSFIIEELMPELTSIGVCSSFEDKIKANSTKYQSIQTFFSGQPATLSRSGLFIPDGGKYYLEIYSKEEKKFLVSMLIDKLNFKQRVQLVEIIDKFGRNLFTKSILLEPFEWYGELKDFFLE